MTAQNHVWIIDDDDSIRWVLQKALEGAGFIVTSFDNANTLSASLVRSGYLVKPKMT